MKNTDKALCWIKYIFVLFCRAVCSFSEILWWRLSTTCRASRNICLSSKLAHFCFLYASVNYALLDYLQKQHS